MQLIAIENMAANNRKKFVCDINLFHSGKRGRERERENCIVTEIMDVLYRYESHLKSRLLAD